MALQKFVGEIALYGTNAAAAAIISWCEGPEAKHKTEAVGWSGEHAEKPSLPSMTHALWVAVEALRAKGLRGTVAVHIQRGEQGLMAAYELGTIVYFGELKFAAAAPAIVISKEWIEANATKA